MTGIIKTDKIQSPAGNDAVTVASNGSITTGAITSTTGTFSTSVATPSLDVNIDTNARLQSATNISEVGNGVFALQVSNQAESALKPMGFRAEDIRFATGNATRARVTDNGITFNADTAAANALDDYEEGTWTPSITANTGTQPTIGGTSSGTYTKVGNLVTVVFEFNSITRSGTVSGLIKIMGLPYSISNNPVGLFSYNQINWARPTNTVFQNLGSDGFGILSSNANADWGWEIISAINTGVGAALRGCITYRTT
jgi:hypothetical protein